MRSSDVYLFILIVFQSVIILRTLYEPIQLQKAIQSIAIKLIIAILLISRKSY